MTTTITIRRATPDDAARIVAVLKEIVAERMYSAIDYPFALEQECEYLKSLSAREGVFLAETADQQVVGFQIIDQWTKLFRSMDHVAQLGTFVLQDWRRRGVGGQLAAHTLAFARSVGYEKLVIYVRASNTGAQAFYAGLGFVTCGRLTRPVRIDGEHDDEIVMEMFLQDEAFVAPMHDHIATERLTLRPFTVQDLEALHRGAPSSQPCQSIGFKRPSCPTTCAHGVSRPSSGSALSVRSCAATDCTIYGNVLLGQCYSGADLMTVRV
jgi:RimJ/RimL family protein N-acetyltransferase